MDKQDFRQMNYFPLHLSDCIVTSRLRRKSSSAMLLFDDPAYNLKAVLPKQTDLDQLGWWVDSQQGLSQWISSDASVIAVAPVIYPEPVVFLTRIRESA
ncbi:MAG: hypothetical protein LBD49_00165 [Oscillospiraceae bacterium]|jgi:hypothetical protein|nr:hypothetical protein [Oscillospiraceae bacterium]